MINFWLGSLLIFLITSLGVVSVIGLIAFIHFIKDIFDNREDEILQ